jgi:hypothetical protein
MAPDEKKVEAFDQQEHETKSENAPDPFDLDRLKLGQSFVETIGVKRVRTRVPVRKPNDQDWIRVHPDPTYRGDFTVIDLKTSENFISSRARSRSNCRESAVRSLYSQRLRP